MRAPEGEVSLEAILWLQHLAHQHLHHATQGSMRLYGMYPDNNAASVYLLLGPYVGTIWVPGPASVPPRPDC